MISSKNYLQTPDKLLNLNDMFFKLVTTT